MQLEAGNPDEYPGIKIVELSSFVLLTIPGKEELNDKPNCNWWNFIFNHAEKIEDRRERDEKIGRYSSAKAPLVDDMEMIANAKYANAQTSLDVWMGWLEVALQLEESATSAACPRKNGGGYLLSESDCPLQAGHNDFTHWKTWNPGYSMLVAGEPHISI